MELVDINTAWISKNGSMLGSLELLLPPPTRYQAGLEVAGDSRAAAEAAIAAALQRAAAAAHGLRLRSFKLRTVNWDGSAILQQLPVNSLTSLYLQIDIAKPFDAEVGEQRLA
jgi:hypothetical protein